MTRFYTFLLLLICTLSFANKTNNNDLANPISTTSIITDLACLNNISEVSKDSIQNNFSISIPIQQKDSVAFAYPPSKRDYRKLGYNTSIYLGATVVAFGILWSMPESASNWDKDEIREKGLLWKWEKNVKAGPVWDKDDWFLNYVTHPISGGIYYMTARSCGFSILESFGYSAFMSTCFWEYGIESFAEVPSTQDLIVTPLIGSIMGEAFFYAKKSIVRHDNKILRSKFLGYTTLFLIDPFNTILDGFGYQEKVKTQMNVTPVGVNQFNNSPVWGVSFSASF